MCAFKFLYVSKSGREEIAAEMYEDEVDLRRSYLNSSFHSAWSEHSVDPDDFRVILLLLLSARQSTVLEQDVPYLRSNTD